MRGEIHGTSLLQQQHNIHPVKVVPRDEKLNISSHTGEEFSEEFLRERLTPRRTPARNDTLQPDTPGKGANVSHNQDFNSHLGTKGRGSDCGAEIHDFSVGKGYGLEVENHEMHDGSSRYRLERAPSGLQHSKFSDGSLSRSGFSGHGSGSPNSYQPYTSGWGFTNSSPSGKMKFLCSFGGKILPRPNDGNLRYVGGETRIMSIRKNLTYIELVRKTNSIFSQPHAIKYQLPGEDLDALISVSCDEDLHHMIEEYHDLERCSQRLRIFLVPLNDPESPCSLDVRTLSHVDSEYQYVVAVNGMLDPSPRWSSSRESLGSQIGSGLDHGSPTAHQMEFWDGTTHKMNHPSTSTQVFNNASPHYHSKSYFSPSMFPSPAKLRESRNSRTKLYEDIPHAESHEFRTPNAMDQPAYHNSYNMDATNYYYNQQKYHPQFHSPAKDFVAFPSFSNVAVDTKQHGVNEMTMQSENLVNSSSRMVHGVSQPQMLNDEGTSATLEERNSFSPNFAMEKSPSFSGLPQQWTIQQQENTEKYPGKRNENMLKHNKFSDRNACNASSMDERSNLPEIVHRVGDIVIHRSLPVEAEGLKIRESASPPSDSLENTGAQQRDHQSRAGESEFPIKSQKETEDPEHPVNISFSSNAMDESVQASCPPFSLNHPPNTDFIFPNPVDRTKSAMVKGPSNSLKKEETLRKTSFQDQMLGYHHSTKQFSSKKAEATFIIEDVTDGIPSNIPSSPTVIPLVQDEPNDGVSPREETESESFADHEEGKSDDDRKKDSIEDPVTIEMEAGIYGLQIIKYGDLEELQELGSGTYGTVYHGKWRGTDVAIKRIKKSCFAGRHSEQDRLTTDFWREAKILSKLHHPNIVAFYGVVPDGPGATLATVTEFMIDGSLRHVLLRKGALDRRKKLMIAMDAAFGMEYLHMKNVVHFDLKCDNLLVNLGDPQRPVCKVGDFGLSRIKHNTLVSGGVRGTLPWMAPELLHGSSNRVSEKVDVFSFGITMWEMLTGEEPYANLHCGAIIGGIVNNTLRPRIPERCDPEWRKLMEECWSPDPSARPSFTEITKRLRVMSMALQAKRTNRVRR